MSENCLFCKIAAGIIPSTEVYADDHVYAFKDLHPQAPIHILIIPRSHIATLDDLTIEDRPIMGHLLERTAHIARELGLSQSGYRTLINCRDHGGQEIYHLHVHLLGGRALGPMLAK
ncbi:MAG: histidine triad nucleotide-binding protein [Magnetococcus sp. DMHC-6]